MGVDIQDLYDRLGIADERTPDPEGEESYNKRRRAETPVKFYPAKLGREKAKVLNKGMACVAERLALKDGFVYLEVRSCLLGLLRACMIDIFSSSPKAGDSGRLVLRVRADEDDTIEDDPFGRNLGTILPAPQLGDMIFPYHHGDETHYIPVTQTTRVRVNPVEGTLSILSDEEEERESQLVLDLRKALARRENGVGPTRPLEPRQADGNKTEKRKGKRKRAREARRRAAMAPSPGGDIAA